MATRPTISNLYQEYKIKPHQYKYIIIIGDLTNNENNGPSNDRISLFARVSPQETGQQTTLLNKLGLIIDCKLHTIKRSWNLTSQGQQCYIDVKEYINGQRT